MGGIFGKPDEEVHITLLGLDNAGKTSCMKRLSDEEIGLVMPTQGFKIETLRMTGFKLDVWDIGGQKALRPFWKQYFEPAQAVIYVIDGSDTSRLEESGVALFDILKDAELKGKPLLIYANKQDLEEAANYGTPEIICEKLMLGRIRDRAWHIQGSSAKTGRGLQEGLDWLLSVLKN